MAKYIGTLTSDARGKIGGLVMTRARNGTNLKAHAVGVNPRSNYQLSLRQNFASAIAAWRAILDTDRTTWELLAPQYTYVNTLGQSYNPTGLQLYTQAFMNATLTASALPPTAPPTPPYVNQIISASLTVVFTAFDIKAFQTGGADYVGAYTASCSSVISNTLNYHRQLRRRPMGFTLTGPSINIATPWALAYGPLPLADYKVSVRVVPFDPVSFISGTPVLQSVYVT
jgi:hypothetical protein